MIFDQLNLGECKTYLIASEKTREALLVDPLLNRVDDYLTEIDKRGLRLKYVMDTHLHADHLSGGTAIKERLKIPYIMHKNTSATTANFHVADGDKLELGDISIRFLHTPGHTQDGLTLMLSDRILTGDFLFLGESGAGRTDLPGGDPGIHWEALQKMKTLPDSCLVFPGHDYRGRKQSTLGEERRLNERLRSRTREEYVVWLRSLRVGPAEWMKEVLKENAAGTKRPDAVFIPVNAGACCEVRGGISPASTLVEELTAEELSKRIQRGETPTLLDVRQPEEFIGELGHIAGARLIPVGELQGRIQEIVGCESQLVVTICRSGKRSAAAAAMLTMAGFKKVRSLQGGMMRWNELGLSVKRDPN